MVITCLKSFCTWTRPLSAPRGHHDFQIRCCHSQGGESRGATCPNPFPIEQLGNDISFQYFQSIDIPNPFQASLGHCSKSKSWKAWKGWLPCASSVGAVEQPGRVAYSGRTVAESWNDIRIASSRSSNREIVCEATFMFLSIFIIIIHIYLYIHIYTINIYTYYLSILFECFLNVSMLSQDLSSPQRTNPKAICVEASECRCDPWRLRRIWRSRWIAMDSDG